MKTYLLGGVAAVSLAVAGLQLAPEAQSQTAASPLNTNAMTVDSRGVLTMAPLLDRVTPAVVNISTTGTRRSMRGDVEDMEEMMRRFFGDRFQAPEQGERPTASVGSGVIVDAREGYVMTNAHVIDDADNVVITLTDNRQLDAEIVGSDEQTDIAILRVDPDNLTEIGFADSEGIRVGDYVVAIGNPFGIGQTVTSGIISAKERQSNFGSDSYQNYLQTDAAINQGNSGGALVNSRGELVGINTAILSRSGGSNGIGFAVPANMARGVMRQLVEYGEVRRGRIGVGIQTVTPALQDAFDLNVARGAIVTQVTDGSPAERAGLRAGDVIVGFDGEEIISANDIRNTVGLVEAGTRTDITFVRDGQRQRATILVEALPEDDADVDEDLVRPARADADMEELDGAMVTAIPDDLELRGGDAGVFVQRVQRGSPAFRAGLRRGDVIRRIDRRAVSDLDDFEAALERRDGATAVEVERAGSPLFFAIR